MATSSHLRLMRSPQDQPTNPRLTLPAGLTGRQQDVFLEVAAGRSTPYEIARTLRLRPAHVHETLDELAAAGLLRTAERAQ